MMAGMSKLFREGDELYGQLTGQRKLRLTVGNDGIASYAASSGEICSRHAVSSTSRVAMRTY